jgi:hypothetical protein
MSPDCRNDCVEPLRFPKRIYNRPGLSHIAYRIGTYADFREALLRNLDRDPILAAWTHREADDPGIALLEGASILGDILTFYQELYANEAYLQTAQWRESIADLVRLLGYYLSPGVGGKATFAFSVKGTQSVIVPTGFPIKAQLADIEQPVDFETVREFVREFIAEPALSQFSLYRPFIYPNIKTKDQTFAIATADLDQQKLKLNKGDRLMLVANPADPQTARQIVVIADTRQHLDLTEITIEGSWQGETLNKNQISAYKLGKSFRYFGYNAPLTVTVVLNNVAIQNPVSFLRNLGVPPTTVPIVNVQAQLINRTLNSRDQIGIFLPPPIGISPPPPIVISPPPPEEPRYFPPLTNSQSFPLDQTVEDLSNGLILLVTLQLSSDRSGLGTTYFFERQITTVSAASATHGALTGGTTVVRLDQSVALGDLVYTDIRSVEFHEVIGKQLTLTSVREPDSTSDRSRLYFYGDGKTYQKLQGRAIHLVQGDRVEQLTVGIEDASKDDITLRPLSLNSPLQHFTLEDFPLDKSPTVVVYGNLVEANQGKTEREAVLGNGDSRQVFQTFKLPKSPLTYFNSKSETPPEVPELQVYVNDRLWQRVPSFFNHGPKEEIYIVREDANGDSWVQFGDGKTGARLPSGIKNIVAKYRTGIGAHGVLKENTSIQGGRLDRLDKIWLPSVVSGGAQPETGENAREAAPGKIQSLGRLVSLKDFESETLAIPGVSKASAAWQLEDNIPTLVVIVLMKNGREKEISEVQQILNRYNHCRGPARFPVMVCPGNLKYVYCDVTVGVDPTLRQELIEKSIKTALGIRGEEGNGIDGSTGLFGIQQRQFGQKEYANRIEGTIQNVQGVVWAKVTAFDDLSLPEPQQSKQAVACKRTEVKPSDLPDPPSPKQLQQVVACDRTEVLSLYKAHLQLSFATTAAKEVC